MWFDEQKNTISTWQFPKWQFERFEIKDTKLSDRRCKWVEAHWINVSEWTKLASLCLRSSERWKLERWVVTYSFWLALSRWMQVEILHYTRRSYGVDEDDEEDSDTSSSLDSNSDPYSIPFQHLISIERHGKQYYCCRREWRNEMPLSACQKLSVNSVCCVVTKIASSDSKWLRWRKFRRMRRKDKIWLAFHFFFFASKCKHAQESLLRSKLDSCQTKESGLQSRRPWNFECMPLRSIKTHYCLHSSLALWHCSCSCPTR